MIEFGWMTVFIFERCEHRVYTLDVPVYVNYIIL
jgi:hypothetical protein